MWPAIDAFTAPYCKYKGVKIKFRISTALNPISNVIVFKNDFLTYTIPRQLKLIRLRGIAENSKNGRIFSAPVYFTPPRTETRKGETMEITQAIIEINKIYPLCNLAKKGGA